MAIIFANNASTTLRQDIGVSDGIIYLASGTGALFPQPVGSDEFYVTLEDYNTDQIEIMICTSRSGDDLTVLRAQEGTAVQAFDKATSIVQNRATAETLTRISIAAGGSGLPAGGLTDEVLAKQSVADGDADWTSALKVRSISVEDIAPKIDVKDTDVALPHEGFRLRDNAGVWALERHETAAFFNVYEFDGATFDFKYPVTINGDATWNAGNFDPDDKEDHLGNPGTDGFVLQSTIAGVRSWASPTAGGSVPTGGPINSLLGKASAADGDTEWQLSPVLQGLTVADDEPAIRLQSLDAGIPVGHEGYEFLDVTGSLLFGRYDTSVFGAIYSFNPVTGKFDFSVTESLTINGSQVITAADGVLLDTDAPTLTGVWTHNDYIRLANNVYLQGKTVGDVNTTLIGINGTDVITVGNQTLPLTLYASADPIVSIDGQPNETLLHTGNFDEATKEDYLDVPGTDGYILSSTIAGVRTWVPASGGGFDVAADYTVTGQWVFSTGAAELPPFFKADNTSSGKSVLGVRGIGDRDYFRIGIDVDSEVNGESVLRQYDNVATTWRDIMHMEPATGVARFDEPIAVDDALGARVQQPRIFVQASDPGTAAAEGDLWIW